MVNFAVAGIFRKINKRNHRIKKKRFHWKLDRKRTGLVGNPGELFLKNTLENYKKVWQGHHCGYDSFFSDSVSVFAVVSLQSRLRTLIQNGSPEIKRNVVLLQC